MRKKILIMCIIAIMVAAIAVVSADSGDDHDSIGAKYNVPTGYTFNQKNIVINSDHVTYVKTGVSYSYLRGSDEVVITIFDLVDPSYTLDDVKKDVRPGYEEITINGIDGFYYDESPSVYFDFVKDGKYIYIKAPDKATLEEILSGTA